MKCPRDGTKLAPVTVGGIQIDKCHQCDGLWFDRGELEQIRQLDQIDIEEQIEREFGNPTFEPGKVDGYMRCPRCPKGRLQQVTYTLQKRVKIDRCESCFGIWIDDTELDSIVGEERALEKVASSSSFRAFLRSASQLLSGGK